jgi:hypothetical protein
VASIVQDVKLQRRARRAVIALATRASTTPALVSEDETVRAHDWPRCCVQGQNHVSTASKIKTKPISTVVVTNVRSVKF